MIEVKNIRTLVGEVVSIAREKTIAVKVERKRVHPKYKKHIRVTKKFHAHVDDGFDCGLGDLVKVQACRPISKTKTWKLIEILEKAK